MKTNFFVTLLIVTTFFVSAQEKPTAANTGASGTLTTYTGDNDITVANTVIENKMINTTLNIQADSVTIRNCIIETSGFYGIKANYGAKALLIEDCEIRGMSSAGILGSNFTARRCNVWDAGGDAFKPTDSFLIEQCYIHHLGYKVDAHADGVQMVSGKDGIIRYNHFDMPEDTGYRNSICMIIQTNNGTIDNILIEHNWINGGGWSMQINDKENGHGVPTNITIQHNLFGRDYQFGTITNDGPITRNCNRWEDTKELLSGETCDTTLVINNDSMPVADTTVFEDTVITDTTVVIEDTTTTDSTVIEDTTMGDTTVFEDTSSTSIQETSISLIQLYPNPVKDQFIISGGDFSDFERVLIYNLNGQIILEQEILSREIKIDQASIPSGKYLLKIQGRQHIYITQLDIINY